MFIILFSRIPTSVKKSRSKISESYTPEDNIPPEIILQTDINACIRIAPSTTSLNSSSTISPSFLHLNSNSIQIKNKTYYFDEIYPSISTQRDIFNSLITPIAEKSLDGVNTSIIAYGQTASGKTYTMFGNLINNNKWGIIPNLFSYYFNQDDNYILKCSFIEIYNEKINDLLDISSPKLTKGKKYKEIRETGDNELYIEDLREYTVKSVDEGMNVLIKGLQNRKTGETKMNLSSSRSHCIFKIKYIYELYIYLLLLDYIQKIIN